MLSGNMFVVSFLDYWKLLLTSLNSFWSCRTQWLKSLYRVKIVRIRGYFRIRKLNIFWMTMINKLSWNTFFINQDYIENEGKLYVFLCAFVHFFFSFLCLMKDLGTCNFQFIIFSIQLIDLPSATFSWYIYNNIDFVTTVDGKWLHKFIWIFVNSSYRVGFVTSHWLWSLTSHWSPTPGRSIDISTRSIWQMMFTRTGQIWTPCDLRHFLFSFLEIKLL